MGRGDHLKLLNLGLKFFNEGSIYFTNGSPTKIKQISILCLKITTMHKLSIDN